MEDGKIIQLNGKQVETIKAFLDLDDVNIETEDKPTVPLQAVEDFFSKQNFIVKNLNEPLIVGLNLEYIKFANILPIYFQVSVYTEQHKLLMYAAFQFTKEHAEIGEILTQLLDCSDCVGFHHAFLNCRDRVKFFKKLLPLEDFIQFTLINKISYYFINNVSYADLILFRHLKIHHIYTYDVPPVILKGMFDEVKLTNNTYFKMNLDNNFNTVTCNRTSLDVVFLQGNTKYNINFDFINNKIKIDNYIEPYMVPALTRRLMALRSLVPIAIPNTLCFTSIDWYSELRQYAIRLTTIADHEDVILTKPKKYNKRGKRKLFK
jgi:hypothetical protein